MAHGMEQLIQHHMVNSNPLIEKYWVQLMSKGKEVDLAECVCVCVSVSLCVSVYMCVCVC